jgi:hypothetical protein
VFIAVCAVLASACGPTSSPKVATSDGTGPTVSLSLEHDGNATSTSNPKLVLSSKTGKLNLVANAEDDESGIQTLEIYVDKISYSCPTQGGTCSVPSHGLQRTPTFQSSTPKKNPGDAMTPSSVMLQWIVLDQAIPQTPPAQGTTRTVEWEVHARAVNNFGTEAVTPLLYAVWSE